MRENRPSNPAVIEPLVDWLFDNSTFWVWEEDGAIQGFSAADARDGSICALFVHPYYERRGIGRALLPLACDVLKQSGHATAVLTTDAGTRAERFYRADGWNEVGRQADGQIVFQKSLSGSQLPTRHSRIHIFGASGAGTTTLGRALADALAIPHHDTDDYYWLPTTPPYRQTRPVADRLRLMREMFVDGSDWVLSGALDSWGDSIVQFFDLAVFVEVRADIRLERLRDREMRHFGAGAVAPGGWRHRETEEFIEWASHYDDGSREGRSLVRHLAWLGALTCPTLRIDGARPLPHIIGDIVRALRR